jgi:hypothetical protein
MTMWRMQEEVIKELVIEELVMKLMDTGVVMKDKDKDKQVKYEVIKELVILE